MTMARNRTAAGPGGPAAALRVRGYGRAGEYRIDSSRPLVAARQSGQPTRGPRWVGCCTRIATAWRTSNAAGRKFDGIGLASWFAEMCRPGDVAGAGERGLDRSVLTSAERGQRGIVIRP